MSYNITVTELTRDDPIAEQPAGAKIVMKRHQLTSLARCVQFENEQMPLSQFPMLRSSHQICDDDYMRTRVGIIGDAVGQGKSYIILSLILSNSSIPTGPSLRSYGSNQVLICTHDNSRRVVKTSLLVIPHNLCSQWSAYVEEFCPQLKCLYVYKTRVLSSFCAMTDDAIAEHDLIVVSSTFYNRAASVLTAKNLKLRRAIFDEVDDVNIPNCAGVHSEFYWFVTASYGNLVWPRGYSRWDPTLFRATWYATGIKNSGFIKNLFSDLSSSVDRDLVKVLVVRNAPEYVQESMLLPEMQTHRVLCKTPVTISILTGLVNRQIIEALNAGDVASAMAHVNPSNRASEDCIIQALLDKFTRQLHNLDTRMTAVLAMHFDSDMERASEVSRLQRVIDDVRRRMASIRERIRTSEQCGICLDAIANKCIVPCCSNAFCFECISRWLTTGRTQVCPMCKQALGMSTLMVVDDAAAPSAAATEGTSAAPAPGTLVSPDNDKYGNLEAILRTRQPGSKFLIFSSYDYSLTKVEPILDRLRITHSTLKGNHAVINSTVNRYKAGDVDVLLINARQYGSGLNLENTTDLVMFHNLDTEISKQVIGRAQRLGRTQPLRTWYLLFENEMQAQSQAQAQAQGNAAAASSHGHGHSHSHSQAAVPHTHGIQDSSRWVQGA